MQAERTFAGSSVVIEIERFMEVISNDGKSAVRLHVEMAAVEILQGPRNSY